MAWGVLRRMSALAALAAAICGCAKPQAAEPQKSPEQLRREQEIAFYITQLDDPERQLAHADTAKHPLFKLIRMGADAVPQLIDALDARQENVRRGASLVLKHLARHNYAYQGTFTYEPDQARAVRRSGVEQFQAWWQQIQSPPEETP